MPIDPRELARIGPGVAIEHDRPCRKCGYNLRGLAVGGRCPECGHPIHFHRGLARFTDNLTDAPIGYLKHLATGLALMAAGSIVGLLAYVAIFFAISRHVVAYGVLVVAAATWWIGVYIATGPRPIEEGTAPDRLLDSPRLRIAGRAAQLAWIGATLALAGAAFGSLGSFGMAAAWGAMLLTFVSLVGLVPLAVQLSGLADWAGDSALADRLRIAAFCIAAGGAAFLLGMGLGSFGAAAGVLQLLGMLTFWGAIVGYAVFLLSLLQLVTTAMWAIRNSESAAESSRRVADREARHQARLAARTLAALEAARQRSAAAPGSEIASRGPNVIERPAGGAEPYTFE